MNDEKLKELEEGVEAKEQKNLLLIESMTIGGVLFFVFQSIAQAVIGFVMLKFLHKWFNKKTAEEKNSS